MPLAAYDRTRMDVSEALIELLAPARLGDEVAFGMRLVRTSVELGLRITLGDGEREVHVEVFPAEPPRKHAARTARLLFAYRIGRGGAPVDPGLGRALCLAVAERAARNEDRVLAALRAEPDVPRIREVRGGRLLQPAGTPERPYDTLSPYVGCLIGCKFCYAQDRLRVVRTMRGLPDVPWGSYVDARADAPQVLRDELRERPIRPIKLCPIVSDPYHAIERTMQLTRRCLEVIAAVPPRPVFVLTRARLVERDADLLEAIPLAQVGFSIPTIDDEVRRAFEPRAAPIAERLEVLQAMRARGLRTFAVVQPVLPGDVHALADALARVADSVSVDVLRGEEGAASTFDRYADARSDAWQRERAQALVAALHARGVPVWDGELPEF